MRVKCPQGWMLKGRKECWRFGALRTLWFGCSEGRGSVGSEGQGPEGLRFVGTGSDVRAVERSEGRRSNDPFFRRSVGIGSNGRKEGRGFERSE